MFDSLVLWCFFRFNCSNECLYFLVVCDYREKDVDIAFAQDAIDEFKVMWCLSCLHVVKCSCI